MLQPHLASVKADAHAHLLLVYVTGERRIFDVQPYLSGPWFGELKDDAYFSAVRLLPDGTGIEWPHGQDIAPHELYERSVPLN